MKEQLTYITDVDILDEVKDNFLVYSSEVLTDRAIPSAEDGLLSVHRKLLWTMEEYLKMDSKGKTKKSASVVGSTLATSYFHGDSACYGALCKLAQTYLMRYPLVIGQGSLGTQESNGMQASARYTEAKPSIYADLMMLDFNKKVVPMKPTYNGEFEEPVVLPGLFPNAIVNGREAIGISMSHGSLPHNLTETCDAILAYLKGELNNVDDVMKYIKGPDFPLGGTVINQKDIKLAFMTGKSDTSIKIRGDYTVDGQIITFHTIPYRVYRDKIREQIGANIDVLAQYIDDFDDKSSKGDNKLVFYVKKGVSTARVLNILFESTDLETTVSYNMNFIVNGTPKMCSMLDLIAYYYEHQTNVLLRATKFDRAKAIDRKHILEGLLLAIKDIDIIIDMIRNAENKSVAQTKIMSYLKIDEIQAQAILDMKLSRLTQLDNTDLLKELKNKEDIIIECNKIINEKDYRDGHIADLITDLKNKYGDTRRTKLDNITVTKEAKEIAAIEPEKCVVVLTAAGNVKRIAAATFKEQKRNGKGVKLQPDDITTAVIRTNTVDNLLVFTNVGKVYKLLVDDIPVGTNTSVGTSLGSLIEFDNNEVVEMVYSLYRDNSFKYILFVTRGGTIKKVATDEFNGIRRRGGMQAIKFKDGDSLATVSFINDEDVIIVTKEGTAIKIKSDFGVSGRTAMGVKGVAITGDNEVVGALPIRNSEDKLALFFSKGQGKKISLDELTLQNRGGKGLRVISAKENYVTAVALVDNEDTLLLTGATNMICVPATDVSLMGRTAVGNIMIKGDSVLNVTKI